MHSFVILASKSGRQVDPSILDRVKHPDLPELFFVPESHVFWSNTNDSIAYCGWQAAAAIGDRGSHWHQGPHGLTAFSGTPYPKPCGWTPEGTWAEQLDRHWSERGVLASDEAFGGIYTGVHLRTEGPSYVITDPFGVGLLYVAETADVVVVANRSSLAARAITTGHERPARDVSTMRWLPLHGYVVGDGTGFAGVRALPLDAYVEFDGDCGPTIRTLWRRARTWGKMSSGPARWRSEPVWKFPDADPEADSIEARIDQTHADLLDNIRAIASLPVRQRIVHLSGGKDARLVLALIVAADVKDAFSFVTFGMPDAPDVQVAHHLAAAYDLNFAYAPTTPQGEVPFEQRLRRHVFQTSGVFDAWDLRGALGIPRTLTLTGVFGELFGRSFYGRTFAPKTLDDIQKLVMSQFRFDVDKLLTDEVREQCRQEIWAEMVTLHEHGVAVEDLFDVFYIQHRNRRWFGASQEVEGALTAFPLQSVTGLRTAFLIDVEPRRKEQLHFELIRRCDVAMSKMPFASDTWSDVCYAHLPDADEYRAIAPVEIDVPTRILWQLVRLEANWDVFARYLVEDRSNPVFTILDRQRVADLVQEQQSPTLVSAVSLYGALTAAVWMGQHEEAARMKLAGT